jgi:sugar lactone lactonase YvrE
MPLTKTSVTKLLSIFALLLCFLIKIEPLTAQAVVIPGVTPVGSSAAPVSVTLGLPSGGTINAVKVFGQGSENVDFVNAGGTCAAGASFLPGQTCTLSVVFTPGSPGQRPGAIVLLDRNNSVLASQLLTASASGSVGVFVPGIISTVAGDANWVYSGDGHSATTSAIFLPFGVAVDAKGDLFIADSSNNRVRRVDAISGLISTIAGNGIVGATGDNGPATAASLNNPTSVALDPAGNVFFADSGNNVVRRIDAFTGVITTVAGTISAHGDSGDNGPATSATFSSPNGISFDANGNLYIADTGNHSIRMVSTSGVITTVAGIGTSGFSGDGGPANKAALDAPWSATPIAAGGFYIADQNNQRIRLVDASGNISTIVGTGASGFSGDNGPANKAQLNVPASVLVDVAGNIYIADSGNNRVRRINASTGVISTIAGNTGESITGDGGPANQAGLYGPYAFALDTQGNIFIADVFHNRIRKVSANTAILNYPVMRVGRVSTPLTQTLENDGNANLDISQFNPVKNSQFDSGTTTCSLTTPLAPVAQCVVGVDFAPTTTGTLVTGEADVDSNSGNSPGVINLSGQVLDVDPTTTSLTSSVNPSTAGQSVTFSVTVTSTGATPTGTITLLDGTATIDTGTLLPGGVISFNISTLTSGSHSLTASYGGDSENAASVSPILVQVVHDQQAATTTSLTSNTSPTLGGAPVIFTATVAVVTPNSGNGNIAGSVSFKQGANVLGVANINNATATAATATATITLTNLPVGTDSIIAVYSGNTNYLGSTSAAFVQTVQLATSKTVISAASPSIAGAALSLTATLTSNGGIPTGSVTFFDGTTSLGQAPINAQGIAVLSVPGRFWTVGAHSLTAVYAGDPNNSGSTSTPIAELINIATTTTTVISSLNPAGLGASVIFTASVTSTGGTPTGTVNFFDGATPLGPGTLTATGASSASATFNTSTLTVGTHPITAVYAGDSFDATSTSTSLSQVIVSATIAATLQSSANPAIFGAPLSLTAKVTGTGSAPTGNVTLLDGAATVTTLPLPANGIVVFSNPSLAIGSHTLTAAYSGDTNHAPVTSAALVQIIQQATTTALSSSATALIAGKSVTLTAVVTGVSAKPLAGNPSGTVKFLDAGALLATITPDATGTAVFPTSNLLPGSHTITAVYSGDPLDATSTSATVTITVTIATTSTTLTTNANPINSGSLLTLSSTVTGNGGTPTGNVTFHDGATVITSIPLTTSGTATYSLSTLTPGIHNLYAVYSGDTLDATSTSPTTAEQIAQQTQVTLTSGTNPSLLQDNVVLSIAVSNGAPSAPPTGSATLTDGGVILTTLTLSPTGTASYTLQAPTLGTHTLVVNYLGDNKNSPAASAALIQTVTLRPSTVNFNPSATAISFGQKVTLISIVQASGSRPPTGTVTWVSGSTTLGSAPIDSTGLATATVTPPQGVFATVAQYSGDTLYAASVSTPTTITVGPPVEFTISLTPSSLSIASGAHASLNVNIASAATFTDTLALGCAGLPVDATCTFSKNQLPVSGGVAQSVSVEVDTGDPLGAGPTAQLKPTGLSNIYAATLPAGAILALALFFNRRRLKINPKLALFSLILLLGIGSSVLSGCGSDLNVNHTPAGSYTFQIVATGNKTSVTSTATVQLTVTP